MQRVTLEKAYVLHRRPYSNTSLLVEFFTEKYGRVCAIARSARGQKSRYRSKLEPFALMMISFAGRGELKTLGDVDFCHAPHTLAGNALMSGFYLNEILMRLLQREDPYGVLFQAYYDTLSQLGQADSVEIILRKFEKKLLKELGFGLPLTVDYVNRKSISAELSYRFVSDRGFESVEVGVEGPDIFPGASLLALHQDDLSNSDNLKDAKRLMRFALAAHLGSKPLKSRELF